jgi:hypothetical protein
LSIKHAAPFAESPLLLYLLRLFLTVAQTFRLSPPLHARLHLKMGLKLEICDESDMARCFEILSEAFGHDHPYIDAAYPAHSTPAGRAVGAARMLKVMQTDPCTTFLKVVDTESGMMIAQAKWNIYRDTIPDEADLDGDFWETGEDKKYAQLLCNQYLIPRRKFIRESKGNVFCKCQMIRCLLCFNFVGMLIS